MTPPRALAELGLIDEYEFVVHPRIAGYGPYVFNGLAEVVDLVPTDRRELESGRRAPLSSAPLKKQAEPHTTGSRRDRECPVCRDNGRRLPTPLSHSDPRPFPATACLCYL